MNATTNNIGRKVRMISDRPLTGSVKADDVGSVTHDLQEGYVAVYWPTRYVTTTEKLGRDVAWTAADRSRSYHERSKRGSRDAHVERASRALSSARMGQG